MNTMNFCSPNSFASIPIPKARSFYECEFLFDVSAHANRVAKHVQLMDPGLKIQNVDLSLV